MDALLAESVSLPSGADHPAFRFTFDYWLSKAPPGMLPGRQHIDPIEMRSVLPNITLIDVERSASGLRFRFRLIGTAVTEFSGYDLTGRYLDEEALAQNGAAERMRLLVTNKQPIYTMQKLISPQREHILTHRLALPLAQDGQTVDMILGCVISERTRRPAALQTEILPPVLRRF